MMNIRACRILILLLFCVALAWQCRAQENGEGGDGLNLPEQQHDYIVKLLERKHYDLVLERSELFLRLHGEEPALAKLADDVSRCGITAALSQTPPDYRNAAARIVVYLKHFPKAKARRSYRLQLGQCYMEMGQSAIALNELTPLLKDDDIVSENATYLAAQCYVKLQKTEEALPLLQKLAALTLDNAHPSRILARKYLAAHKAQTGDSSGALADYRALLDGSVLNNDDRGEILLAIGELCYRNLKNYSDAASYLSRYLVENPNTPQANAVRRMLIDCRYQLNEWDVFVQMSERYQQELPQEFARDNRLCLQLAQVYQQRGQVEKALPLLKTLNENQTLAPQLHDEVVLSYAKALLATKQYELLRKTVGEYLEFTPNASTRPLLLVYCGDAAIAMTDYVGAIAALRVAMPLLTTEPQLYQYAGRKLAVLLQNDKQFAEAALVWKQLADATKDDAIYEVRYNAAQCYYHAGNFAEAKTLAAQLANAVDTPDECVKNALLLQCRIALDVEKDYASALKLLNALIKRSDAAEKFNYLSTVAILNIQLKHADAAIEAYREALSIPEATSAQRGKVLLHLVYLELQQQQYDAALEHAGALFACTPSPSIPAGLLNSIAKTAISRDQQKLAQLAWQRIIASSDADATLKQKSTLQLAESMLDAPPEKAKQLLASFAQATQLSPDAEALLAELEVRQKHYDRALIHANRALSSTQNAVLPNTAARALWTKATVLYERDHAHKQALDMAIPCFIMHEKCEPYATNCRKLAITIYRAMGEEEKATALGEE